MSFTSSVEYAPGGILFFLFPFSLEFNLILFMDTRVIEQKMLVLWMLNM